MTLAGLRVAIVGPLPPPEGGMANQTRQLAELLEREGAEVRLVRTNAPYRPSFVQHLRFIREPFRFVPYLFQVWRATAHADIFHVMANSGWAWHLRAAPAVLIARARRISCVVNYRGGEAREFLERSSPAVLKIMACASVLVVPSAFLQGVFERWGVRSSVVPNIIDLQRFRPDGSSKRHPHLIVARSLEQIYDIPTALRAFALIHRDVPEARLTVAGSGPERGALVSLSVDLGIADAVDFCGRLDRDEMAALNRSASVVLNPSRVDNMPNSVLEAMASGAPVVSTNVGGVPFILRHDVCGILVPPGDQMAMAAAALRLLRDRAYANRLSQAALQEVQQYTWPQVRQRWAAVYASARAGARIESKAA
jgi:glycosyltransferase involved in cell wall biosynthesis